MKKIVIVWQHLFMLISSTFYLTFFPDSLAHIFSNCFSDSCNELSTCQSHEKLIVVYISGGNSFLYWTIKKGKDQILFDSSIKFGAPKYISVIRKKNSWPYIKAEALFDLLHSEYILPIQIGSFFGLPFSSRISRGGSLQKAIFMWNCGLNFETFAVSKLGFQ